MVVATGPFAFVSQSEVSVKCRKGFETIRIPLAFSLAEEHAGPSQPHSQLAPHLSRPCELNLVLEDGRKMFDIFINEPRGSVHWLDSAKDFEEAKRKAKKLYAGHPAEYFAFDGYTQTRFVFTLEQLGYRTGQKST